MKWMFSSCLLRALWNELDWFVKQKHFIMMTCPRYYKNQISCYVAHLQ